MFPRAGEVRSESGQRMVINLVMHGTLYSVKQKCLHVMSKAIAAKLTDGEFQTRCPTTEKC